MQNKKPEKILGKKFVRGKPYYKIKWQGASKDHSSWQSPASLRQFKSMVNKYEVKNWGSPLDQKFYDPALYETKAMTPRRKVVEKKVSKTVKKIEKKKIQEPSEGESDSEDASSTSEEEEEINGKEKEEEREEIEEPPVHKKAVPKPGKASEEELEIIDLDSEGPQKQSEKDKVPSNIAPEKKEVVVQKKAIETGKGEERRASEINIDELDLRRNQREALEIETNEYRKDLGLTLPSPPVPTPTPTPKQLSYSKSLNLEIEPSKSICRIAHIYHLQKVSMGNHLYLVQFKDKEMRKMSTKDLIERYPDQLVGFLEGKYREKLRM